MTQSILDFDDVRRWLEALPSQKMGDPWSVCETGEFYVEFLAGGLARPGDERVIEREVARQFCHNLSLYFKDREGTVYWRMPFETAVQDSWVVDRYDDNGPDEDVITGRKCFLDKNWRSVKCYARLYRAHRVTASDSEKRRMSDGTSSNQ